MSNFSNLSKNVDNDVAIVWKDLSYSEPSLMGFKSKLILNNISGYLKFGTLTAQMGPSGPEMSAFIQIINGLRNSRLSPETELYLNRSKAIRPCYVEQDVSSHLLYGLTAKQSLIYASRLKNSDENFKVDHQSNVKKLMADLMISDTENTRINRCSGGEQKRLAIAAELTAIKMPNLLCIDEPTSGLDSNAAEVVIKCLKEVAQKHHIAMMATIYQPNSEILVMFDKLYVLSKGGKCIYFGEPQHLLEHLKLSDVECKSFQVPIELLIKCSTKGSKNESVIELVNRNYYNNKYLIAKYRSECKLSMTGVQRKHKRFSFGNFFYLFMRCAFNTIQSQWLTLIVQSIITASLGIVIANLGNTSIGKPDGCVNSGNTDTNGNTSNSNNACLLGAEALAAESIINQNITFLFIVGALIEFLQIVITSISFGSEIKIFFNEHQNGWYGTSSYYWAKSLFELPLPVINTALYVYFGYQASNQIDENFRQIGFMYLIVMGILCCQGFGFLMCTVFDTNTQLSITSAIICFILSMFLCDFFVPLVDMHEILQWLSSLSFMKSTIHSSIIYVYGFGRCGDEDNSGSVAFPLREFDLLDDESFKLWLNHGLILSNFAVIRILTLFVLLRKANPSNKKIKSINAVDVAVEANGGNQYNYDQH